MKINISNLHFLSLFVVASLALSAVGCHKSKPGSDESDTADTNSVPGTSRSGMPFNYMLGVNGFDWDYTTNAAFDQAKFKQIQSFSGFRMYLDWDRVEKKENFFQFSYDEIFDKNKAAGIITLVCLQIMPNWFRQKYYADEYNPEDPYGSLRDYTPVPKGANKEDPASYIAMARLGFHFAGRYGHNKKLSPALVKAYGWGNTDDTKIGLGTLNYLECSNEPDKNWKGPQAQQSPEQYAAQLSAFYDGHMGTLGAGIGVKTADPDMKVVMAGIAIPNADFVRRMVAWCKKNRVKNGKYSLCFDVINFHEYASVRSGEYWNNPDLKNNHGIAPEISDAAKTAASFVSLKQEIKNDLPVSPEIWVTECGFDVNPNSIQRALPIGKKNIEQTQADWTLRTALLYARMGIDRVFFYMLNDVDENSPTQYNSSGLLSEDHKPRAAANYILQAGNLIGNYIYEKTLNADPLVDLYLNKDKRKAYVLTVPDQQGRTEDYTLQLNPGTKAVTVYHPREGSSKMNSKKIRVVHNEISLEVSETPTFVLETP